MKGIILIAGKATRLYPATLCISKGLITVYDKPMIYYPLATLMEAGITEVLIIVSESDLTSYQCQLGDGSNWGISIQYAIQYQARGIADAFIIGADFIGNDSVCLILGDNIFHGPNLTSLLEQATKQESGATVFGSYTAEPERFGVAAFDENGLVYDIEEKPQNPKSNYAVTGLYFYDNQVVKIAGELEPSARGELEITDVNKKYLLQKQLKLLRLGKDCQWFDAGTHDSLLETANYIAKLETEQGSKIACPELIAWQKGYISTPQFQQLAKQLAKSSYGQYLLIKLGEKNENS